MLGMQIAQHAKNLTKGLLSVPIYINILRLLNYLCLLITVLLRNRLHLRKNTQKSSVYSKVKKQKRVEGEKQNREYLTTINKFVKLQQTIGITRQILRIVITIDQILFLIENTQDLLIGSFNSDNFLLFVVILTDTIFCIFDFLTLVYYITSQQTKLTLADQRGLIFGSIPSSFFASIRFGVLAYKYEFHGSFGIQLTILNLIENSLDCALFSHQYWMKDKLKVIGYLGIITSITRIIRNLW